jgi:DNA-binding XRE family transcriptional regulator
MSKPVAGNYLRAHRRKRGLSQRELGMLVGYDREWQVSRHERGQTTPPLLIALAYEVVFEVPTAELFKGFHSAATDAVTRNLAKMKAAFEGQTKGRPSKAASHKLQWLTLRTK